MFTLATGLRPAPASASGSAAASSVMPRGIVTIQRASAVIAAIHLLALALVLLHQDVIRSVVFADNAGQSPAQLDVAATSAVLQSVIPHILIPIFLIRRARGLISGRRSAQIGLTVLLAIQLAAHATLPLVLHRVPGFELETIAVQAVSLGFELVVLSLLWLDRDVRAWFSPAR